MAATTNNPPPKTQSKPEKDPIDWADIDPVSRGSSKYSGEKNNDYQEFFKKGEFNMRNELYIMAVVNFLKAYELLKRSGQGETDDEVFGNLVNISICIALCQKEMGSVEEASNILRATMDSISCREKNTVTLQEWYTFICCKVSEILIQTHKYQEAHEMVTEGLGSIKSPKDSVKYMRRFVE